MNCLVDTHYLLWSLIEPQRIEKPVQAILESDEHVKYVSSVSFWEISLKYALGKLELEGTTPEEILETSGESGFELLQLDPREAATSYQLPKIADHKDPFDRMLIWQCIQRDLTMVSSDPRMREYKGFGLRLL